MQFYGLLGEKLSHSLSPKINKIILEKNNTEGAYKLFEIPKDKLDNFVEAVKLLKIKGFNVTIPYKESIMKYLDCISDEATRIGAVNTVMLKENIPFNNHIRCIVENTIGRRSGKRRVRRIDIAVSIRQEK